MSLAHPLADALARFAPRALLDLACAVFVVRAVYLPRHGRGEHAFTFAVLNAVTFAVTFMLSTVRVEMGLALGLFGVFGILRYRTEALRIRDLTYLFVMIGLAMLNGVAGSELDLAQIALLDGAVLLTLAGLELAPGARGTETVTVRYDRLELLAPARREALLADLSERLGVPCVRVSVGGVDLMHDSAELQVTFQTRAR